MEDQELLEELIDIICLSWRDLTTSRLQGVPRKWKSYCSQSGIDPLVTDVETVLDFLYSMYKGGCMYSGICVARSARSSAAIIPV